MRLFCIVENNLSGFGDGCVFPFPKIIIAGTENVIIRVRLKVERVVCVENAGAELACVRNERVVFFPRKLLCPQCAAFGQLLPLRRAF